VTTANVGVKRPDNTAVSGSPTVIDGGYTIKFTFTVGLGYGEQFTMWTNAALKATDNSALPAYTGRFTTSTIGTPIRTDLGATTGHTGPGGEVWEADRCKNGAVQTFASNPVTGASDLTMIRSVRQGTSTSTAFSCSWALPNGTYTIKIHFFEPSLGVGVRKADWNISATAVNPDLNDFDINATAGGINKAITQTFTGVAITARVLSVTNTAVAGFNFPIGSGIEIIPTGP
jgi:hypothetical protein